MQDFGNRPVINETNKLTCLRCLQIEGTKHQMQLIPFSIYTIIYNGELFIKYCLTFMMINKKKVINIEIGVLSSNHLFNTFF